MSIRVITKHNETTFWDNLIARRTPDGTIQIAYGHHRLIALQRLGVEEVDIPVRDLDDATMIKIMANENKTEWSHEDPKIINETVRAARDFLNAELAKYDSYEQACHGGKFTTVIFSSNSQFMQCKGIDTKTGKMIGVGRDIILNSLAKDYGKNLKLE